MNVLNIIGILVGFFATGFCLYCDELPKNRLDVIEFLERFNGKLILHSSFGKELLCSILTYNSTDSIMTMTNPNGKVKHFHLTRDRPGVLMKKDLDTGVEKVRRVAHHLENKNGTFACLYTCDCNGKYAESYDCVITSSRFADDADRAVKSTRLVLGENQTRSKC